MKQQELHNTSISNPVEFWKQQASQLHWLKSPSVILEPTTNGYQQWFSDGELNMADLCLDEHLRNGRANQAALVYDSPVSSTKQTYTYADLHREVVAFSAGLVKQGLTKGDTVIIYMPMIPQAVIAMLACARLGVIHSVVFGGFAPHELALRIDDCCPKALITADYGIEIDKILPYTPLVKAALDESTHQPNAVIVYHRGKLDVPLVINNAIDFTGICDYTATVEPVSVVSTHPLYILYTSGTTGKPKGVLRDTGGYATALRFSLTHFYGASPGDVFFAASDLGWVVGHSYIAYGPLLQGCTTILYEGKPIRTPDSGAFWRLIQEYRVNVMFTAPTAIRAIRKEDPDGIEALKYNLSSLRTLFLAGERCDITTWNWIGGVLGCPVVDHWWQTESGWPMLGVMACNGAIHTKAGSAGMPVPGFKISILDEAMHEVPAGKEGYIAIQLPLPPGFMSTLWNNEERFLNGYLRHFPGYYTSGDGGWCDEDGYVYVTGRVDDVINVSGHRLSTGEMEELLATHPAISECAVVGINDELKGQLPMAFVVVHDQCKKTAAEVKYELIALIREKIGAIACFKNVLFVKRLPKTRSGKILRKTLRMMVDKAEYAIPSTIEDAAVLPEIQEMLDKFVVQP